MADIALDPRRRRQDLPRRGKPAVHAVKTLTMEVSKGEIVALLGSSGCGKTSTLRMIAGFEEVSQRLDRARRPARSSTCRRPSAMSPWPSKAIRSIRR